MTTVSHDLDGPIDGAYLRLSAKSCRVGLQGDVDVQDLPRLAAAAGALAYQFEMLAFAMEADQSAVAIGT